jgi:hypothetical protein
MNVLIAQLHVINHTLDASNAAPPSSSVARRVRRRARRDARDTFHRTRRVIRFIVLVCRRASERGGALKDATTDVFDVSRGVRHD